MKNLEHNSDTAKQAKIESLQRLLAQANKQGRYDEAGRIRHRLANLIGQPPKSSSAPESHK